MQITNEKQAQEAANVVWINAYLNKLKGNALVEEVKSKLEEQGITDKDWDIKVSDSGISINKKIPLSYVPGSYEGEELIKTWEQLKAENAFVSENGIISDAVFGKIGRNFKISDEITIIGVATFDEHYSLESVTIPASVTKIETYAFGSCEHLENVMYYGTYEPEIQTDAFQGCGVLITVKVSKNYIGDTFAGRPVEKCL